MLKFRACAGKDLTFRLTFKTVLMNAKDQPVIRCGAKKDKGLMSQCIGNEGKLLIPCAVLVKTKDQW